MLKIGFLSFGGGRRGAGQIIGLDTYGTTAYLTEHYGIPEPQSRGEANFMQFRNVDRRILRL